MKKIVFILLSLLLCSGMIMAKHIPESVARTVAANFWRQKVACALTSADGVQRAVESGDFEVRDLPFSCFYVFNLRGGDGFVIVAAHDVAMPVLGYSSRNAFPAEAELPLNTRRWLEGYEAEIATAVKDGIPQDEQTALLWNDLQSSAPVSDTPALRPKGVAPLLNTVWAQNDPFNALTPMVGESHTLLGCGAVAMAQIMYYWRFPEHGIGSQSYNLPPYGTLSADFATATYHYDLMTPTYGTQSTDEEKNAVATLMYHCALALETRFDVGGSASNPQNWVKALRYSFGYSPQMQYLKSSEYATSVWRSMLKDELDNGRPLLYTGNNEANTSGHGFVCDGYDQDYMHFVFGWRGYCDGYYSLTSIIPSHNGTDAGMGNYSAIQYAVFNIAPAGNSGARLSMVQDLRLVGSQPFSYGSEIVVAEGKAKNIGDSPFVGYINIGIYNNSNELLFTRGADYTTSGLPMNGARNFTNLTFYPSDIDLPVGDYTARAICSTDGTHWQFIDESTNSGTAPFRIVGVGIDTPNASRALLSAHHLTITVLGAPAGCPYLMADMAGRTIASGSTDGGTLQIVAPKPGLYILTLDATAHKLLLR